jgi:hypothetical protein
MVSGLSGRTKILVIVVKIAGSWGRGEVYKLLSIDYVLLHSFYNNFYITPYHFRNNSGRYYRKVVGSSNKVRNFSSGYKQMSVKFPKVKYHENSCSGKRFVSCGRPDRHDGDCRRFS